MKFLDRKKNIEVAAEEEEDRLIRTDYELIETRDGRVAVLAQSRVIHFNMKRMVRGYVVDANGKVTTQVLVFEYDEIKEHNAVDYSTKTRAFISNYERTPRSLTI